MDFYPGTHRHRSATSTLLAGMLVALGGNAQAQTAPANDAARQGQIIELQQRERLRDLQERALPQPAAPQGADLQNLQPKIALPKVEGGCHDIKALHIEGATLLSEADRADFARAYTGRCVGAEDVQTLLAALTKHYIDRGYITTRVYLPEQNLGTGTLTLRVVEGTIERYEVKQKGHPGNNLWVRGAFPPNPGDILNLRALEQGQEQANSLPSNHTTIDLVPGTEPGQSVVVVTNQARRPEHLQVVYDNLGSDSTGRHNLAATGSLDGVLGFNELISYTHSQTIPRDSAHEAHADALHFALPYGYYTFSLDASRSTYDNALTLPSGQVVLSTGPSTRYTAGLSRVVDRSQTSLTSLFAQLNITDSKNYLNGELLSTNSRELASFTVGASRYTQVLGGALNGKLAYERGVAAFGALHDASDLPGDYPHAQFDKLALDLNYQHLVSLGPIKLQWNAQLSGQYSAQTLFGTEQFLIGSASTVRGFRMSSLSGDNGVLFRNDLAWPWSVSVANQQIRGTVYGGFDAGRVGNHASGTGFAGSMTSATLGATAQWRGASAELFVSRALHRPAFLINEGTVVGFRLSYSL